MKLTRHNGRSGKHGTYNPRHNDRRFDVENSEHIDAERARQNVYWDCYRGFTTHEFRENPEQPDFSFEEIELINQTLLILLTAYLKISIHLPQKIQDRKSVV